jgi:hypothetical protein
MWDSYVEFYEPLIIVVWISTMQFPLSVHRILISLLSLRNFNAIDSFLVMLDVKGPDSSNIYGLFKKFQNCFFFL